MLGLGKGESYVRRKVWGLNWRGGNIGLVTLRVRNSAYDIAQVSEEERGDLEADLGKLSGRALAKRGGEAADIGGGREKKRISYGFWSKKTTGRAFWGRLAPDFWRGGGGGARSCEFLFKP